MNKKLLFAVFTLAIMAVSCSVNETEDINITASDAISLAPSTAITRALVSNLDTLQNAPDGFVVYATAGASPTAWYDGGSGAVIDGSNNHVYVSSKWGFKTNVSWPATDYPMTFYAFYPAATNAAVKNLTATWTPQQTLILGVEIPLEIDKQIDLLAGMRRTTAKPISGSLNMAFKHILSKVSFSVTNTIGDPAAATTTQTVDVLALGFVNLKYKNTYDVLTPKWGTVDAAIDTFNFYNSFDVLTGADVYTAKSFIGKTKGDFYSPADTFQMLLPQIVKKWNTTGTPAVETPKVDESYVRMLYRVEESSPLNVDFIGFKSATTHSGYVGSELEVRGYNGPLYVLVGYSFSQPTNGWEPGKGYHYEIPVPGGTGGRLLDDRLYDNQGNPTTLKVPGGKVPDVIIPANSDDIRLDPTVTNWDDNTTTAIEE